LKKEFIRFYKQPHCGKEENVMSKLLIYSKNYLRGFTLIELMVVILIIGVLVTIAIPVYNSTQEKAKETACRANIRMIKGAIVQAELDGEEFSIGELNDLSNLAKYFEAIPECPDKGDYTVKINADGKHTIVCSKHNQSEGSEN